MEWKSSTVNEKQKFRQQYTAAILNLVELGKGKGFQAN